MTRHLAKTLTPTSGRVFSLQISSKTWRTLEKAYGHRIAPEDRKKIQSITDDYVAHATIEINAQNVKDVQRKLRRLRSLADNLHVFFCPPPSINIHWQVQHLIMNNFGNRYLGEAAEGPNGYSNDPIVNIESVLASVLEASDRADAVLSDPKWQLINGSAWDLWMRNFIEILAGAGMPIGVRKDSDKNAGRSSPLVELVRELQSLLPSDLRRHQSDAALAKAILKVRAETVGTIPSE